MAVTSFAYMTQDSLKSIDIITNGFLIWAEGEGLTLNYTEEHGLHLPNTLDLKQEGKKKKNIRIAAQINLFDFLVFSPDPAPFLIVKY